MIKIVHFDRCTSGMTAGKERFRCVKWKLRHKQVILYTVFENHSKSLKLQHLEHLRQSKKYHHGKLKVQFFPVPFYN